MIRYELSALAEADLEEIWFHVAADRGTDTANRLIDGIVGRIALVGDHPLAGRERPELLPELRSFAVRNYVIYYQAERGRILHGRRDHAAVLR